MALIAHCLAPVRNRRITSCFLQQNKNFFKRKSKPSTKIDPYMIVRATPDDTCQILDLMWSAYHPDEPTTKSLGLGKHRNCVFDEQARKILAKGYSVVAKCKYNGSVVGAALCESCSPWDPAMTEKLACTLKDPKMARLYMFWAYLQRAPNLWEKYCQMNIYEIVNVFVRHEDRQRGLAKRLMATAKENGADAGYKVIRVDASSTATAKICEKLKMKLVYEIPFCSYVSEQNEVIFKVPDPTSIKIYVDTPHWVPQKK